MQSNQLHVTLIHGTFARNASWTKDGSVLRERLRLAFGEQIIFHDDFAWSGWPSHLARHTAAKRLKDYLLELTSNHSGRHVLVGHSHGGMACAYALRDADLQTRISGLITLSTPFLVAKRREFSVLGKIVGITALFALMFIPGFVFGYYAPIVQPILVGSWPGIAPFLSTQFYMICGIFFWVLIGLSVLAVRLTRLLVPTLQIPRLGPKRTLIVRGPSDEASALLTLFHAVELIVTALWGRRNPLDSFLRTTASGAWKKISEHADRRFGVMLMTLGTSLAVLLACLLGLALGYHPNSKAEAFDIVLSLWHHRPWGPVAVACAFLLSLPIVTAYCLVLMVLLLIATIGAPFAVLMLVVFMLCVVLAIVTIPELGPAAIMLTVSVEAAPPGTFTIVQLPGETSSSSDGFLLHSLSYTSPTAADEIIRWLHELLLVRDDEPIVMTPIERPPVRKRPRPRT